MAKTAPSPRRRAVECLVGKLTRFPDMPPGDPDLVGLSPPDAALALSIARTTVQRMVTLRLIVERFLGKPMTKHEPALQAVLLTGAAQLLFMDRLPAYAVVDQAVGLARSLVRPGATGLVNAVLRRVQSYTSREQGPWAPSADAIPMPGGGVIRLKEPRLVSPDQLGQHLAQATSLSRRLCEDWIEHAGPDMAIARALHSIAVPPMVVTLEPGAEPEDSDTPAWDAHDRPGFGVWRAGRERLGDWLAEHPDRRVQDPTSASALEVLRHHASGWQPKRVLDACAGRGTKSRQLTRMFPEAELFAFEPDEDRFLSLQQSAQEYGRLTALRPGDTLPEAVDLILLDVPCSNTGVLARRPEARYRYSQAGLGSVVQLQRKIVAEHLPRLSPGGRLVYATCSLEPAENRNQARRMLREQGLKLVAEQSAEPGGAGTSYQDGGYAALLTRDGSACIPPAE